MALRASKAVLVFAIALFYTILVLNNITDYGSNYEFVRHVLMMDSTFPGNHGMWRAVNSPLVHTVFYISIIAWESVTMLLCWWAGVRLLKLYRADREQFAAALNVAMIALTTSLLMWLVAFLDVGGEWFLMWQSKMWNGRKRHSECLPSSVWCFWWWCSASQHPISRLHSSGNGKTDTFSYAP
jgi:predicted small integral membrane protein